MPCPAPRAEAARVAPRAQLTAIPEPGKEPEPVPAAASIPAGAALAAAASLAQAATITYPDEVVVIDPAAVTLSRRESQGYKLYT